MPNWRSWHGPACRVAPAPATPQRRRGSSFDDASAGLPHDADTWTCEEVGGFLTRLGASEALVQHFATECIDGEALLLLTEAHLDKYFEAESALGLRLKLLKGIERAKHHHRDGFMSPMSQMLGAGLATAGAVAGAAAVVAFGSDGNAPDWQVKGFKQARDVVTGLAVGYESILLVGGVFVSWIPPGAHLIVLLPVVFGLAFEVLVYFKTWPPSGKKGGQCKGKSQKEHDALLETASTDPRLAYNYAQTEDGDADREQGRKVQERTLRVMRFSLFLGLLVVAGVFLGFLLGGLLTDKPTLIIACIIFPLAFLLVLALNLKYALGVSKGDQQDFDKLYRETDAEAPAPAAEP